MADQDHFNPNIATTYIGLIEKPWIKAVAALIGFLFAILYPASESVKETLQLAGYAFVPRYQYSLLTKISIFNQKC